MIFRFFVNSGEHDFFVKRLKNMAIAAGSNPAKSSNVYSDETTQMGSQTDIDYPEATSGHKY